MQPKGSDSSGPFPLPSALMGAQGGPSKPLPTTSPLGSTVGRREGRERSWESRVREITGTTRGKLRGQDEEERRRTIKHTGEMTTKEVES